jgi:hypothetical protein
MRSEIVNTILGICAGLSRIKHCSQNYELSIGVHKQLGLLLFTDVKL